MNWDAIGVVGEIIGATAVVVSLAYLAIQIRTQNRQARTAAMHEISVGFRDAIATFANVENAEVITKANRDFDALSETEIFVLIAGLQRILRVWEEAYFQHRQGQLESHIWDPMAHQYSSYLSMPALNRVWDLRKEFFSSEFREFAENLELSEYRIN